MKSLGEFVVLLVGCAIVFPLVFYFLLWRENRPGPTQQQVAKQEQSDFKKNFETASLTPSDLQSKLMFKKMTDVASLLGRPDSTSRGDSVWHYRDRVIHPVTGKPDTLYITFDADQVTSFLQAGVDGTQWALK